MSDFVFKKKFGQNFISDKNLLNAICADAEISQNDEVLEIGAGAGSLTSALSARAKKVVSFEIDKDLEETLLTLKLPNVEFVFDDFMRIDMQEVEKKFEKTYKVVANLPYYITSPIIFRFLEEGKRASALTIMVQKEVAERVCAKVGGSDYGVLSVLTNFYGNAKITRIIDRKMFFPEPKVDSALLNIQIVCGRFPDIDGQKFSDFVKTCFAMRRKTLLNNLSLAFDKNKLRGLLSEEILQKRPQSLSLEEFVELFKILN